MPSSLASRMPLSLDSLPVELILAIVAQIEPDDIQRSLLSLSRAIPRSGVSVFLLFEKIRLTRQEQVFQLYRRLHDAPEDAARVRVFILECWTVDADVFVNLMALLPALVRLVIYVGPNFAPEHLEEIFHNPREGLKFVSMRFRPYVQRATYYQFLKGAYFDSTLVALSRWLPQALPTLSVVQDPLDSALAPTSFAQPLVFHQLNPLTLLAASPLCHDLRHLRLRVPRRQICRYLHAKPCSFPSLELLDMSTSNVSIRDLEGLLAHVSSIRTLVLDGCPVVTQRTDIQLDAGEPFLQWMELGQTLALAGVRRASEREKQLKAWVENYYANAQEEASSQAGSSKKGKRGRKGVATATFSLRAASPEQKGMPDVTIPLERIPPYGQKVRVLPSAPKLRSIATSYPGGVTPEAYQAIQEEFERGWASGIARLSSIRFRLRTTYQNGVARIVRFADRGTEEWEEEGVHGEQGLAGLVDVRDVNSFALNLVDHAEPGGSPEGQIGLACPVLCLAGAERAGDHVEGCGHRVGWDIFQDEI
ncbi:hypothetical protein C8Q80DRAFT_1129401 [Daedaleopsis nitida]|nr:hypothetical protein C8Q80DRAFT_1129401 [Daedaleopsis nitida]